MLYRVFCPNNNRISKLIKKEDIKAHIKEEKRIDKILTYKRRYIILIETKSWNTN